MRLVGPASASDIFSRFYRDFVSVSCQIRDRRSRGVTGIRIGLVESRTLVALCYATQDGLRAQHSLRVCSSAGTTGASSEDRSKLFQVPTGSMAAHDTKTQFRLSTGAITVGHINAAGEDMALLVSLDHWLQVASGGLLTATTLALGSFEFSQRQLEVAMYQMIKMDDALFNRSIRSLVVSLQLAAEKLQECLDEGMPWTVLGGLNEAIACRVFLGRRCARTRPAQWLFGHSTSAGSAATHRERFAGRSDILR